MTRDHNFSALAQYGGVRQLWMHLFLLVTLLSVCIVNIMLVYFLRQVKGLSNLLKTNLEMGISGDDADLSKRRNSFGSNTYPLKKGRSFWVLCDIVSLFILSISIFLGIYCSLLCILLLHLIEFSLGGLARFNTYHLDCGCRSFIGTGNKDRGNLILLVKFI